MTPTKWQHIQQMIDSALELPEQERPAFLEEACAHNRELLREVQGLIASYELAGDFLEEAVDASIHETLERGPLVDGDHIGPYQISGVIGHGGMGTVYSARRVDDQFRQRVAIKVMRDGLGENSGLLSRFRAERQILATLNHPNIARLLDGGVTARGLPYFVMEYIDGAAIDRFAEDRALNIRERLHLYQKVCAAIQYAHQNLIVHRDIKPANVMVTEDGTAKLLDFGIAKLLSREALDQTVALTRPADRLMTPEYASPEQIRGEAITTATDVYALGVLLYELLTQQRPFQATDSSLATLEHMICDTSPERPSRARKSTEKAQMDAIPADLDNIVLKAMHRDPSCRYGSAAELANDVRNYLEGFPVTARADSWGYRARKFISRHKMATAVATLFLFTTTTLSIGLAIQARQAKREAETSNQVADFIVNLFEYSRPDETQGRPPGAREILDVGAMRAAAELASQPAIEARLFQILGTTYRELGVFDRAESVLARAYKIRSRLFGADSPEAAESLQTLGEIASDRGELQAARDDYQKVLSVYKRRYGLKSEKTVEVITDIGELRWMLGDYTGAKELYVQAIELCNQFKSPSDWQVLDVKNDLQLVLAGQGDYSRAETLARDVLATEMQAFGPSNPNVGLTLNNLAYVLAQTAHYREAAVTFQQALDLRRKVDGPTHPAVAMSLSNLGWIARELGHYDEAQSLGDQAVSMAEKVDGPHSLGTAACQGQLGLTMLAKSKFPEARRLLEASLATRLALGNANNPELADNYDRVGLLELRTNNLVAAQKDVLQGLAIRKSFYGLAHDGVATSLNHLGEVLTAEGDYQQAEEKYREAIRIARSKFKGDHTITAEGLMGLGTALIAEGRTSEAVSSLTETLAMRRRLLPPGHPDIAATERALAKITAAPR